VKVLTIFYRNKSLIVFFTDLNKKFTNIDGVFKDPTLLIEG